MDIKDCTQEGARVPLQITNENIYPILFTRIYSPTKELILALQKSLYYTHYNRYSKLTVTISL